MDEGSRQAAAPAANPSLSQQVRQFVAPRALLLSTAEPSAQTDEAGLDDTQTADSGTAVVLTKAGGGSITRDDPVVVSPSAPPSDD